jgi:hypothetical protein
VPDNSGPHLFKAILFKAIGRNFDLTPALEAPAPTLPLSTKSSGIIILSQSTITSITYFKCDLNLYKIFFWEHLRVINNNLDMI